MRDVMRVAVLATLTCLAGALVSRSSKTPVEKVIQLLESLAKQITDEGAKEAAEYDKFACFCKEQADAKLYAIERSTERITVLTAEIDKLTTEITALDSEISDLGKTITDLEGDITTEERARKAEYDAYAIANQNVTEAIEAVHAAIKAIKDHKAQMVGNADLNLRQVQQLVGKKATALLVDAPPGQPRSYKYRSNDIISTLQFLERSFKENKQALDDEEFKSASASAKKVLGFENEKKFAEKAKTEKEQLSASKSEDKQAFEQEKTQETTDKASDQEFQTELTTQCQAKATEWDSRSQSRAAELTAISEASALLKSGVSPNYEANKRLVGLITGPKPKVHELSKGIAARKVPVALLQLRGASDHASREAAILQRTLAAISKAATSLKSDVLSALTLKMEMQDDHFVKVRGLIKDLIARLEAEATAEQTAKAFCDTEMGKAIESRDSESSKVESATATISSEQSKKKALQKDIATLSEEIAQLSNALREASELRQAEKEDNAKTVSMANAGKADVEQAIQILEAYYNFAQTGYKPPKSDRDGNTVGDLAPETSFSGDYSGKQDASKGIIGLLQVIVSDFERTVTTVESQETQAQTDFDTFKGETKQSIGTKDADVKTKEGDVETAEAAIVAAKDDLKTASGLKQTALEELEKLKAMCVEGEETSAERSEKRKQEIAALREALKILQEWK